MALVAASRISMHYGGPLLLADVTCKVEPGQRIGLIGRNGTGKTTLLRLLGGLLDPTDGQVVLPKSTKVAYQAQELQMAPGRTVFEEMRSLFREDQRREERLRALEHDLATDDDESARARRLREYERLQEEQRRRGVYDIDRRIESVLTSLGLPEPAWAKPIDGFSGGERNVIGLARVLLAEPDLMLLDEPSNHLDMEGVEWFIDFLRRTRAAFLMVSHNRHLLDATVKEIWELESQDITRWSGSYEDYQRQKAEALALQERQYKVQQRLIRRIEFQARRLMDMANAYDDPGQAKRAKAMMKRIDRMDKVERPQGDGRTFKASMRAAGRHGRIALEVNDFSFAFGDRVLFDHADLEIEYGDRVCLVGPNGSGKTTLFREILEHGGWENPTLRLGKSVKVGEYRQLHDVLDQDAPLVEWVMAVTGLLRKDAADLLHRFLFARDDLDRPIATLSGGEKSRVQLARLVHERVNFLFLDEPTNHIDIASCEILEEMLQDFDGTLFVISHDRYFLDKLVDRVVEVKAHKLLVHRCTFAAWWAAHGQGEDGRRTALEDRSKPASDKTDARRAFASRREDRRAERRRAGRILQLEAEIDRLEAERDELERAVQEAWSKGGDPSAAQALSRAFEAVELELEARWAAWTDAADGTAEEST